MRTTPPRGALLPKPAVLAMSVMTLVVVVLPGACKREQPAAPAAPAVPASTAPESPPPPAAGELADVTEHTSDYLIGISYPAVAAQYPALAQELQIQGIPLIVLFRDGREVARQAGAMPARQIVAWARQHAG